MQFGILGPLEVLGDERPLALSGDKQRALLALLVIHANRTLSSDRLIDELWGERPPASASKTLQVHISRLRKALEQHARKDGDGIVVTRERGYELSVDREAVDALRFERLIGEARGALAVGRVDHAASLWEEALSLWRGPPLAEFAYERFARTEIARLEELWIGAREDLIEAKLALGRHAEVVGELEALISEHAYRERLRAQLMLALYRSDRQAEALQAYQDARHTLVEELGIEPGERLRELEAAILAQDPALAFIGQEAAVSQPAPGTSRSTFVGRERELAELVAGFDDARAGRGRLVLVVGEPGIGKSRLAEELIARAEPRDALVLIGRCWEAGGAPAYWPWVQSLQAYARKSEPGVLRSELGPGAAHLAQILPELRERLPDIGDPPTMDPEGARFRLFLAAAELLRNASKRRVLVLVLDDLHAADAPSLLLLRFLARELGSMRVLIVGAYRDVDPTPGAPLTEMLAEVTREPVTRRLALRGLSEGEVEQYVQLTASEIASTELVASLHTETEGNPLFVGEIVRLLAVEREAGPDGGARLRIPQSVRDVIARRLTHLSAGCYQLLAAAAVIGREFAIETLASAAGVSEDEVFALLDEGITARVVREAPGERGRLRFAHVLIRDTLYQDLGPARRVELHRQVVRALEALYGEQPGPHLAELAHQASAAREFEKAVRYAWEAADHSLALLAFEEAARLYQTALELLDSTAVGERCQLLLSLGEAQSRAGDSQAAQITSLEAATIARRLGLGRELARAAACYGGRLAWARASGDSRLVPLLEEGLAALADEDVELRARLLARLSGALRDEPSRERRDALSREAVELARAFGNDAALAYALDGRAAAIFAPDSFRECFEASTELCEVASRIRDGERIMHGHWGRFFALVTLGDTVGAEADLSAARAIAQELTQPVQLWEVLAAEAMLALGMGSLAQAQVLIPEAWALGEHAQPDLAVGAYWFQRFMLADMLGGMEEVESPLRDLVRRYPSRGVFRCAIAYLEARLGRLPEARRALDALVDDVEALQFDQEWLFGMTLIAEAATRTGETTACAALYPLLAPWAELNAADAPEGMRGSVERYLGLLATALGRPRQAAVHFDMAVEANRRMGAKPWLAHSEREYAKLLLARDKPGDRDRAVQLLGEAIALYRELGMDGWAAEATDLQGALQAKPAGRQ